MGPRADDDGPPPRLLRLGDDGMDALDERACRVQHPAVPRRQLVIDRPAHTVGADDDRAALRRIARRLDRAHALGCEFLDHMTVVDDRPQRHRTGARCRLPRRPSPLPGGRRSRSPPSWRLLLAFRHLPDFLFHDALQRLDAGRQIKRAGIEDDSVLGLL